MFLLPAIGAWISDGLILYLYFTDNRAGHSSNITHHKNGASLNDFVMCGNGLIPCLPHYSVPSHDDIGNGNKRGRTLLISPLSSTTSSIGSEDNTDVTDDIIIKSTYDYSTRTDESSSQFAPESKSSKTIHNENDEPIDDDNKVSIPLSTIENKTGYLAILALIRIILLTFPLSYAAYSGTRVPCVIVQFIFQGISSMIVVSHMLAVLILDPVGMQVSPDGNPFDPSGNPSSSLLLGSQTDTSNTDTVHEGDAWTLLSLSLVSIMLHFLIVLHVRSTGPVEDGLYEEKRKRKRLAYAMAAQSNGLARGRGGSKSDEEQVNGHHDEEDFADETPLLLPEGNNNKKLSRKKSIKERFLCLPDQYEAFMTDTQARFEAAQQMWAERLEIMTQSLQQNNMNNSAHGDGGRMNSGRDMSSLQSSPTRTVESSNLLTKLVPIKPDPFKVLLQLFAYEDVWSGTYSRLDLAFAAGDVIKSNDGDLISSQGSAALSFYAPQLLSFLLHGAYFDISSKLEEWILKKCGEDLHFAHRCFWFLRSWCLGGSLEERKPSHAHSLSSGSFGRIATDISIDHTELGGGSQVQHLRGVESNLYISSCQGSIPTSPLFRVNDSSFAGADPPGTLAWNNYAGADGFGESTLSSSKFTADEQVLIEQLLDRVVQRGSRPARVVEYGSLDGIATDDGNSNDNDFSSPSALAMAVEEGLVPVDPKSGPSTAHLDCITSPHKHGFLPLNNSGEPYQNPSGDSLFFAAPVFLDALLSIADDLMNVSRSNRTVELRQRLKSLEVELLPSNVVYLPIQNMQHRVWRIVSDESIALSTNERVPCIITLEVIDYGSSSSTDTVANNDSDVTSAWVSTPRPKHRHSTLIDKVANITQEGLGRLQDTIDHISHHGDGRPGVLDRRLSDFLVGRDSWKRSAPLYTTVGSYEDDVEHHSGQDEESPLEERELGELQSSATKTNELKRDDDDDDILKKLPAPPLGGPLMSENGDEAPQPRSPTPTSNLSNNQNDDIQKSPLGQWTPRKNSPRLRKRNMGSIEDIAEEGYESDEDIQSPQGKQRKRVMFPPTTANMTRSESFGDEPRTNSPVEPEPDDAHHLVTVAPTVVFKEDWRTKTERLRKSSIYGHHPGWRLLPILIKSNDDLRQEQLASQLIQRMATILAKARVPVWLFPYEIVALTPRGGIIECVPDTISLDSLKKNDPDFTSLKSFFQLHFGGPGSDEYSNAKACFVESLAAYSIVCFLMQIKDRHNGNILLDNKGHIVHIDFGFYFLSSPGKNSGFESAPFKLTRDFVSLLGGPDSHTFHKFRELCYKTFIELRKNCYQLILLVEMLMEGNEDLQCFRGRPEEAVQQLKERFRLDLNDNGIRKYVDSLIDESLENWRTRWYDRYQRFCVGVL